MDLKLFEKIYYNDYDGDDAEVVEEKYHSRTNWGVRFLVVIKYKNRFYRALVDTADCGDTFDSLKEVLPRRDTTIVYDPIGG